MRGKGKGERGRRGEEITEREGERERRVEDVIAQWQPWNLRWVSEEPVGGFVLASE